MPSRAFVYLHNIKKSFLGSICRVHRANTFSHSGGESLALFKEKVSSVEVFVLASSGTVVTVSCPTNQWKTILILPNTGSLGGVEPFAKAHGLSKTKARQLIQQQLSYTLHKPRRNHFPTLPTLAFGIDQQWDIDLIDLQKLAKWNKGTKYLLTVMCFPSTLGANP